MPYELEVTVFVSRVGLRQWSRHGLGGLPLAVSSSEQTTCAFQRRWKRKTILISGSVPFRSRLFQERDSARKKQVPYPLGAFKLKAPPEGLDSEETSTVPLERMRKISLSLWSQLPIGTAQRDRCSCCNVDWRCDPQMSIRSQETRKEKSVAMKNRRSVARRACDCSVCQMKMVARPAA